MPARDRPAVTVADLDRLASTNVMLRPDLGQLAAIPPPLRLRIVTTPGDDGIVVSDDMIKVGAAILYEYGGLGSNTAVHLAEDVYRAMAVRAGSPRSTD